VRVGAIQTIFDNKVVARVGNDAIQRSAPTENTNWFAGVGTRYAFTEQWAVSFGLDYYVKIGDARGKANVPSPRVGFAHRF
jgi:long-subunit fatty acid transport protein